MRLFTITKARSLWNSAITALAFAAGSSGIGKDPDSWTEAAGRGAPSAPEPSREFRGVWVATVYNLDWPSKPGLPVETQQAELLEILDGAAALHLNAVVLQVRTMCDAFYASPLEPWSYYLTGELGKAPDPFWDPLEFAVAEAHSRGLELHAWFNPFRAVTTQYGPSMPDSHISRQYPWLVKASGRTQWLDPSSEFVRNRAITAICDVVNRYDVDAVHLDDYFYPYPGRSGESGLDDADNWNDYRLGQGGPLDRDSWRRNLVNHLIKDLYHEVKRAKPWVKLGISPFGIWRPGYPEGIRGMDAFNEIYADSRTWLREGWVDYLSPQLYWKMKGPQSFESLNRWWQDQNVEGRHLWPGMATSRIGRGGEGDRRGAGEIFSQIEATRNYRGKTTGSGQLHWHWEAFATNRDGIKKSLPARLYREHSLTPPSPWLAKLEKDPEPLPWATKLSVSKPKGKSDPTQFTWLTTGGGETVRWWLVQTGTRVESKKPGWTWATAPLVPGDRSTTAVAEPADVDVISVRAVDAYGRLGPASVWQRQSAEDLALSQIPIDDVPQRESE